MNVDIVLDLFVAMFLLVLIIAGRGIRGLLGFIFITIGIFGFVLSGIDSALALFSSTWSFPERLYHFGWVWVGILAAYVYVQSWRITLRRVREKEQEHE